jgi:hypothetical protein
MAGISGTIGAIGGIAGAAGSLMGGGPAAGGIPKWKKKADKENWKYGKGVAERMTTAPQSADELAGIQGVRDMQGFLDPDLAGAQATAGQLAQGISHADIQNFYNPFENDVVGAFMGDLDEMRGRTDLDVNSQAEAAGAFGGGREAVLRGQLQGERERYGAGALSDIRSRGYEGARDTALSNQQLRIGGNAQLADMILARRRGRASDVGALYGSGLAQRGYDQESRDLEQRQLDVRLRAAGGPAQPGPAGGPGGGGLLGAMAGFQDGYRGAQDLYGIWGNRGSGNNGNSRRPGEQN